jgi:hypothetical protein
MNVRKALELITSEQVVAVKNNFTTVTSWHFEYEGVEYRFVEWEGLLYKVESVSLPRVCLDIVWCTEEAKKLYGHLEANQIQEG